LITAVGSDRVGIADAISEEILKFRCNIEESKMAVLGGEFAMLILVSGEETELAHLEASLPKFAKHAHLTLSIKQTRGAEPIAAGRLYRIETTSIDTPGIVHAVTDLLKAYRVSIDELESEVSGAPFAGNPMFHMTIRVIIPADVQIATLRRALEEISEAQDLDLRLEPIRPNGG
jgi:glycine cleavage system transcriptional repressor